MSSDNNFTLVCEAGANQPHVTLSLLSNLPNVISLPMILHMYTENDITSTCVISPSTVETPTSTVNKGSAAEVPSVCRHNAQTSTGGSRSACCHCT